MAMQGAQSIKLELEQARLDLEIARRAQDLNRMSELQYGKIPELEQKLDFATLSEKRQSTLLKNKVTDTEIADVLSRWTGIPVNKMLEGEKDKLVWKKSCIPE